MSEKLALSEEILMKIEKPARYIGQEVNAVVKDREKVSVRFAMCFPDVYEIGMSHLGIQILYDMFNAMEDVWCERVYSPWVDLDQIMRKEQIPLFALESQDPVKEFDFLGITIQYEMCYTNILQILDLAQIPLLAADRKEDCPIVIGGGPCTYNPEPIADFFDMFYIGEGETRYEELLELYRECRRTGCGRREFLRRAASIPGMYVPGFYEATYHEDGTIADFRPKEEGIPTKILKEIAVDVTDIPYPMKPVVPYIKVTQDRVVLEIQRGCIRGCRFCQAGQLYRPVRERDVERLKEYAVKMLANTGHEEISLSSLSSSDYSRLPELIDFLIEECRESHTNISLPSLRIDAFSLDVMEKVQDVKKSSLTFAPEAGSQRLRDVINKGLTEDVILQGAALAFAGGWSRVKLYFMLGLPTETEEDIRGIAELSNKIAATYFETVPKEKRANGSVQIVASTSFFVPKPFTPFQWAPQCTKEEFIEKAYQTRRAVSEQLNQKRIKYNWHEADASVMEGVLARGDRRLSQVILKVYEKGGFFDAWSEYYQHERWLEALAECGLSVEFYANRERALDEIFPWDFIDCGVTKEFFAREWKKAQAEQISENCKEKCQGCGAARFGCGICTEKRAQVGGAGDGSVQAGKVQDGSARNGSVRNDGTMADGGTRDGSMQNDGTVADGSTGDGSVRNDGTVADGGTQGSMQDKNAGNGNTAADMPRDNNITEKVAQNTNEQKNIRLRVKFSKHGAVRFIGHLDVMRFFQKAIRRAGIDVAYSTGFSPHQIMSFAAPLGVGLESNGEYMDIELHSLTSCEDVQKRLNDASVPGIRILEARVLPEGAGNAMASVAAASYTVSFAAGKAPEMDFGKAIPEFLAKEDVFITKEGKNGPRQVNIRPGIYSLEEKDGVLSMLVDASSAGNIKPIQVIEALLAQDGAVLGENALHVTRQETYRVKADSAKGAGASGVCGRFVPLGEVEE